MKLPGFVPAGRADTRALLRAEEAERLVASGILVPERLATRVRGRFQGRGTTALLDLGGIPAVLRRYRHGGLLRLFSRDLYLDRRGVAEAAALEELRARGAPCPVPLAVLEEDAGFGGLIRQSLATLAIPGARAAPEALAGLPVRERRRRLARLAEAVRALHDAGGDHADLNARNLVLDGSGRGWVVDLDRAVVHPGPLPAHRRAANLRRLARSWRKLDPEGRVVSPRDALAFARAYAGGRLGGLPRGAPGAPPRPRFPAGLGYDLALLLLSPLVLATLAWLVLVRGRFAGSWRQRLGLCAPPRPPGPRPILVHAASVGEATSAVALVRELRRAFPGVPVVISTLSDAGNEAARRLALGDAVTFLPADLPGIPGRFLDRLAPRLVVMLETEIWCGFYRALEERGIPLATAGARIAPNRVGRYRSLGFLYRRLMRIPDYFGMQSRDDAERVMAMGAPRGRVHVPGDLKYDSVLGNLSDPRRDRFLALRRGERPFLVAGSVHPGEAEAVLDAFGSLRARRPGVRLVIAPRHLDKVPAVLAAARSRGLDARLRSEAGALASAAVIVLDTMGELAFAYEGCRVAFVGGSLVPVGGHSPLEPAVFRVPVLFGPQAYNFATTNRALVEAGGAREVGDGMALAAAWEELLAEPRRAGAMGEAAHGVLASWGGACRTIAVDLATRWPGLSGTSS